jgi:beta-glucosidase
MMHNPPEYRERGKEGTCDCPACPRHTPDLDCSSTMPLSKTALSTSLLYVVCLICAQAICLADETPVYKDSNAPLDERVDDLFSRLQPDEKLHLLTGTGFTTQPIPRLGVPAMAMADAGQGVRGGPKTLLGPATAFPAGVNMASTWDVDLLTKIGTAIGQEARNKGTGAQCLLGPAVNIQRSPLGGRNGEYLSEDPFLAAQLCVAYIRGVQSTGIASCVKHYACNNEEADRDTVNVKIGERALREIYLPAFEAAVTQGHVFAVMDSYNQVNGAHSSANKYLLIDVLKKGWGFDGLVMSDWGAVHQTPVAEYGNDLEMPGGEFATVDKLKAALKDGSLTQSAVDDSVKRILRTVIRVGLLDNPPKPDAKIVNSPKHQRLALEVARQSIVLLKNENALLPLNRTKIHSIALIGDSADKLQVGAEGSPAVTPFFTIQIVDGVKKLAGPDANVTCLASKFDQPLASNFTAEYFQGTKLEGTPTLKRVEAQINFDAQASPWPIATNKDFCVRWTGQLKVPQPGTYSLFFQGDNIFHVSIDGKTVMQHRRKGPVSSADADVDLQPDKPHKIEIEYFHTADHPADHSVAKLTWLPPTDVPYAAAVALAKASDVAVVCISTRHTEGEGHDRRAMDLPNNQDRLIQCIAAANKNTVVLLNNGTPITMNHWIKQVPALLETWFPGEEGGQAIAEILFGDVNPSGKLPTTLAVNRTDYPDFGNFPGTDGAVNYAEGIYVGYRHFDKKSIEPLFPFGFGMSYTTFDYKNVRLSQQTLSPGGSVQASIDVTNTGTRPGSEIVELYVHDPNPQIDKPVRELKGFAKVSLEPGQTKTVIVPITPRDLAYFDVAGKQWKADAGLYEIQIGASSRDIRGTANLRLNETFTDPVPLSQDFAGPVTHP